MIIIVAHNRLFSDEEIKRIYYEEYIGQHIGIPTLAKKYNHKFYDNFKMLGLPIRNDKEKGKKYTCNSNYFKDIDTEEKAYWFGFCYGDGYLTHTTNTIKFGMSIMEDDYHHLEKFKKTIEYNGNIKTYEVKSHGYKIGARYCRVIISDDIFSQNLIDHGLVEHKSNIMKPPLGIPNELIQHWIRGFMDANGSIMITRNEDTCDNYGISFTSTKEVLDYIQQFLFKNRAINRIYPYRKRKEEHKVTQVSFGGNYQVKQFLDYIYKDAHVWLDRKYERYLELCRLLKEREENKRINKCEYCGCEDSSEFDMWHHGGEYDGKILCRRHYDHLKKYGKIIPDKKDYCEVCGEYLPERQLHQLGVSWGEEWHGKTVCEKHYYQLSYHGKIIDPTPKRKEHRKVS